MSTDHTEIEWQFDAADLEAVERWLASQTGAQGITVRPDKTREQMDSYCDTADWRIFHAGYALRVRRIGDHAEATLKSLALAGKGEARHRREISEDLPGGALTDDALALLRQTQGDLGRRMRALAGTHALRRLFELHTQRRVYALSIAGTSAGEIALDETRIVARPRGKEAHLRRVEVEVLDDSAAGLATFVKEMCQACELRPAMVTKFESGLLAQRLTPTPPPHFGPTAVDKSSTIGDLALAVLRKQFAAFLEHEPGVRLDEDVEELHDMRLAAGRVRAALRLFNRILPAQITDLTNDVRWISSTLGVMRDLDVQMQWVSVGADAVTQLLAQKRQDAYAELMRALDSSRYEWFKSHMAALLTHPSKLPKRASRGASKVAPGLIKGYYRKARRLGDALGPDSSPTDYHALRIRLKRLRYGLDFIKTIYGKPAKRMLKRVTLLADMLGEYHDMQVAGQQMDEWRGDPNAAQLQETLDVLARRCAARGEELRAQFPDLYAPLSDKCWDDLRRAMKG